MFEDELPLRNTFVVTVKDIIKKLEALHNIPLDKFHSCVEECFDRYSYEGVDELIGFESWGSLQSDGEYQLSIKIDHEDAYEFTLHTKVKENKVSIYNVL